MDPNAKLEELRGYADRINWHLHRGRWDEAVTAGELLADVFEDLDEWLSSGGSLPAPWKGEN